MTDQQVYFLCNTRKYNLKIDPLIAPLILPCWSHVIVMGALCTLKDNNTEKVAAMNIQIPL